VITSLAGTGTPGYNGDGTLATSSQVNLPPSSRPDIYGNVYIADRGNHRIRKIDAITGIISTIARTGVAGFSGDGGPAISAQLSSPVGLAVMHDGTLFISDYGNNRIRKISPDGLISTYAGTGIAGFQGDGGLASNARINNAWGLTFDNDSNLYIADRGNDRVRKIDFATNIIITVAGTGTAGYSGDAGPAVSANLNKPISIAFDQTNNLYIADENNHRVRKVESGTGTINTIAGTGTNGYNGNGLAATASRLNFPSGVGVDNAGNVYISDRSNHRIRKIETSGILNNIAGTGTVGFSGDGGNATAAQLNYPRELYTDGSGNIYFADTDNNRIRKLTFCNLPSVPVVSASTTNICAGEVTSLSISNGNLNAATDWQWYNQGCGSGNVGNGTSIIVNPGVTTTYYVRGEGGCVTAYGCASITVEVNQAPASPSAISGNTNLCGINSQTYSIAQVSGATQYIWDLPAGWTGNSNSESITVTNANTSGAITVTAVNSCGSSPPQSISVTTNVIDTAIIDFGSYFSSAAGNATYQWIDCNTQGLISGANNQDYYPQSNGNYAVIISQNNCVDTSSCLSFLTTALQAITKADNIRIAFNNANQSIIIHGIYKSSSKLNIYNSAGALVYQTDALIDDSPIDVSFLENGIYLVSLPLPGNTWKFLKLKNE
jgi:sugar lactone lactonase YvrE